MTEHDILFWMIPATGSMVTLIGLGIFGQLKAINKSIEKLAITMAVLDTKVKHHEHRIGRLETHHK